MKKKSQITLIIIIALVILFIISILVYAITSSTKTKVNKEIKESPVPSISTTAVKKYVKDCLDSVSIKAVEIIGMQGGYIYPVHYRDEVFIKRAYLYYNQTPYVPTIKIMEQEISRYINENLGKCINSSDFPSMNISIGLPNTKTSISNTSIIIETDLPIKIKVGSSSAKLEHFTTKVNSRLSLLRDIAENIIYKQIENPGKVDYSYLKSLKEQGINVSYNSNYFDTIQYTLMDYNITPRKDEVYTFSFYEQYNYPEIFKNNSAPYFVNLTNLIAKANKKFYYKVKALDSEGDPIKYYSDTMLFSINSTSGVISFTPSEFFIGEHLIPIYIEDSHGAKNFAIIKLIIIS